MLSEERKKLGAENMAFAAYMAHKFDSLPLEWDERYSAALYGLVKAAEQYRPETGYKFASFASVVISNEIRMLVRKEKRRIRTLPLDAPINGEDGDSFAELLADKTAERGYERIDVVDQISRVREKLKGRKKQLLELVIENPDLYQQDYADKLGISQSQVSRLFTSIRRQMSGGG